jgi:hypothetical protein
MKICVEAATTRKKQSLINNSQATINNKPTLKQLPVIQLSMFMNHDFALFFACSGKLLRFVCGFIEIL